MKEKEDTLLIVAIVISLSSLIILAHIVGGNDATLKMEKQAIANGAATYTKKGEFKWK